MNAAPIYVACEQGTPEWFKLRAGVITASCFTHCCETQKRDPTKLYDKGEKLVYKLAVERIYGQRLEEEDAFETWQMKRGSELEAKARHTFETRTGMVMYEAGIIFTHDRKFGYSTDGYIENRKVLGEIKCPASAQKLYDLWVTRDVSEYVYQMQGGMWISGAELAKLIIYSPALASIQRDLLVIDVPRDEKFIERMEEALVRFERRVSEVERQLRGG